MSKEVDYHYCPNCGFRMSDVEYMSIITEIDCPGRGDTSCGTRIGKFRTKYLPPNPTEQNQN